MKKILIKDLLMDRTQHVNIGGECLEDVAAMSGVPQGGVLDPTLFTLLTICQKF